MSWYEAIAQYDCYGKRVGVALIKPSRLIEVQMYKDLRKISYLPDSHKSIFAINFTTIRVAIVRYLWYLRSTFVQLHWLAFRDLIGSRY